MRKVKSITEERTPSSEKRLPSHRQKRVGETIRSILGDIFARQDFINPDLAGRMITMTHVTISPDLQYAKVYISPLMYAEDDEMTHVLQALKEEAKNLRYQMAQKLTLKFTPQLVFARDETMAHAAHMDTLFERIQRT